jgi:hypothetical protein
MKLWLPVYLLGLSFCALCATCSELSYPHEISENVISVSPNVILQQLLQDPSDLLSAFRIHYQRFEQGVQAAVLNPTDATVLARLGDDLDEFANLVHEVSTDFLFSH